jgi:hypothetical protein
MPTVPRLRNPEKCNPQPEISFLNVLGREGALTLAAWKISL